jgi:hypothetical protein
MRESVFLAWLRFCFRGRSCFSSAIPDPFLTLVGKTPERGQHNMLFLKITCNYGLILQAITLSKTRIYPLLQRVTGGLR